MIVSYYTKKTHYEREVAGLIDSCEKFSLEYDIVGIDCRGSWETNCSYKPRFLITMLEKHQRPIIWIDIDAIVAQKPLLFETLTCDIATTVNFDLPDDHPSKVLSGTIFINNTSPARALLKSWAEKVAGEEWDQVALRKALAETTCAFTPLPQEYTAIKGRNTKDPVIVHYQASRHYKKLINKEVLPLFGMHEWNAKDFADFLPPAIATEGGHQAGIDSIRPSDT